MKRFLYPTLGLLILFLVSCKKDTTNGVSSVATAQQLSAYPFGVGHEWQYAEEIVFSETGADSIIDHYTKKYTHLSDTTINGMLCHKVKIAQYNTSGALDYMQYVYYGNKADGLYSVAEEGISSGYMFFRQSKYHELLQKHIFPEIHTSATDSVFIADSSLHLTQLPVAYNQNWRSYEYGLLFTWQREWMNPASVNVPAGTYACEKLKVIPPGSSQNFKIYQYYSNKGLIKVETKQDNLIGSSGTVGWMRTKAELVNVNF